MSSQPATVLASEVRLLKSDHSGREYRITISLPYAYEKPWVAGFPADHARDQWPVVYLLDANWFFGLVTDITRNMAWCGRTSDAIVVGIGYPESDDPQETLLNAVARRVNDLLPFRFESDEKQMSEYTKRPAPAGDGERFHQFIRNELIPLIESEFRAEPTKRVLVGHSSGGTFGTFALLHEPELFDAYVLASPELGWGNRFLFKQEEAYSAANKRLKARVHLSAGEWEEGTNDTTHSDVIRFHALVESRNYEALTFDKHIFAKLNHCEVVAPAFQAGLLWALRNYVR